MGNAALIPQNSNGQVQFLEHHALFNLINNGGQLTLLDLRPLDHFDARHLRLSYHLGQSSDIANVLDIALGNTINGVKVSVRGTYQFVIMLPSGPEVDEGRNAIIAAFVQHILDLGGEIASSHKVPNTNDTVEPTLAANAGFRAIVYVCHAIEQFIENYSDCSLLFHDPMNPPNRLKYYATEIIPNFLYLGDYVNATDLSQLRELKISHLIDATHLNTSQAAAVSLGIAYLRLISGIVRRRILLSSSRVLMRSLARHGKRINPKVNAIESWFTAVLAGHAVPRSSLPSSWPIGRCHY